MAMLLNKHIFIRNIFGILNYPGCLDRKNEGYPQEPNLRVNARLWKKLDTWWVLSAVAIFSSGRKERETTRAELSSLLCIFSQFFRNWFHARNNGALKLSWRVWTPSSRKYGYWRTRFQKQTSCSKWWRPVLTNWPADLFPKRTRNMTFTPISQWVWSPTVSLWSSHARKGLRRAR